MVWMVACCFVSRLLTRCLSSQSGDVNIVGVYLTLETNENLTLNTRNKPSSFELFRFQDMVDVGTFLEARPLNILKMR